MRLRYVQKRFQLGISEHREDVWAMVHGERSVVIDAPVELVFAVVSDPRLNPAWSNMFLTTELTSPAPMGVGTTFRSTVRILGRRFEADGVITEYDLNRRACVRTTTGPVPTRGCRIVEPVSAGTRLTQTFEVEIGGFFGIADPLVVRAGLRQLEADLETLKVLIESGTLVPGQ